MFVKELEITLENGMKISGELDLPERQGQWKTIILFHGSGPSDRHATVESMGGIVSRNFDLLSEGFVKARYAVFRYDKRENYDIEIIIRDVKGERWYRTGDRGRRWADGTIEFLGRMDTQVKIRGHRIELGEIESVLKSISRIKEAVVVAQGDKYHKELVAFYLGEYIAESEIEDYLKIHLPEYSIPNSINRLENFPLNANGKVDRRRLAEYQKTDSVEIMSDKVLNIVLMIWEELLKNKVADLDENLFKIGADSLLAARFVAAINARCGIEVRMKEVFMNPSINALTKLVDKRKNTDIAEFVEEGEI